VTVNGKASLPETIANTGGATVTISQIAVSGTGFSLSGVTTPMTLTSGENATFHVVFSPTSATSASGSVAVTSDASNPSLSIPLSGTGTATAGQLAVSPNPLAIGSVVVGTSGSASGTLTASGASVTITSASTDNATFAVSDLTLPVTITAGQSIPFTVTFTPAAAGAVTSTLSFVSDASNSPTTETLTGTGEAAPTYDVALSWSASTSSNISGYNVYRAVYSNSTCGSFAKINPTLNDSTAYTDSVVVDGTSYCYAATAVNSSNQESAYSNVVSDVQIPAP
jgi:Abnormal spindle-like microcephaly-assoc'd, ASPM-SPD-2-Hydin